MAETKYWDCRGSKQEPHPTEEVEIGESCPECGRTYVKKRNTGGGATAPVGKILGGVALLALLGGGLGWYFSRDPGEDPTQTATTTTTPTTTTTSTTPTTPTAPTTPTTPTPTPTPTPSNTATSPLDYSWEPERFTKGQRSLFSGVSSPSLKNGIEAFKQKDYQKAIKDFNQAIIRNPNEPEPLILFNNAQARKQGNPLTLAVVVPITGNINSAKEMLRGVAMAQHEFNDQGGIGDRFLEIVIANDENDPKISQQVALQIADDADVVGVIGHNSSSASQAGLEVYETHELAMISPTSSSTDLQSDIFFRTTPSDAAAAEKLAQYATDKLGISKVVIFYNPNSNYSKSLKENFEFRFTGEVVKIIDLSDPGFSAEGEMMASIYQEEAEAALLFPNTDYIEFAREVAMVNAHKIKEKRKRIKLLGGDALYTSDTLIQGGENLEGLVIAVPWFRHSPESRTFKQAGSNQWKGSVNWRTAMSYDATKAFISSFSNNNNTRLSVIEGLRQVKLSSNNTSGLDVQFTAQGERLGEPVLVEVSRGVPERPNGTEFGYKSLD